MPINSDLAQVTGAETGYIFFFFFVMVIGFAMLSFAPVAVGAVESEPDFAAAPPLVPLAPV
jgi:hypothetical protein